MFFLSYLTSRLDLPETQLGKLQMVQNSAARLITGIKRRNHITPVMYRLHWLLIHQRIVFKLLLLVYRAVPTSFVTPYTPTRSLRSAEKALLTVPRYYLERCSCQSFSVAGPILWNVLPHAVRNADSVATFKT